MTRIDFSGEIGRLQRELTECHDIIVRRAEVFEALRLKTGEAVLDVGCGGGFFTFEAARFVGNTGKVRAIDLSQEQVSAAQKRCANLPQVDCRVADAQKLPFNDSEFDAVFCVNALEYIPEIDQAILEIRRVLKPGGRLVISAVNWSSLVWYSENPKRMRKMVTATVENHAPHRDLPSELPNRLFNARLQLTYQKPVPILNLNYNQNSFSYHFSKILSIIAKGTELLPATLVDDWLAEFEPLEAKQSYYFSSSSFLTVAYKPT